MNFFSRKSGLRVFQTQETFSLYPVCPTCQGLSSARHPQPHSTLRGVFKRVPLLPQIPTHYLAPVPLPSRFTKKLVLKCKLLQIHQLVKDPWFPFSSSRAPFPQDSWVLVGVWEWEEHGVWAVR